MKKQGKNAKKYNIIAGQQYGPYIAIGETIRENKRGIERLWKVKHLVTEKETIMRPSYLNIVENKYNDKIIKGEIQIGLKNYLYKNCMRGAELRGHSFNLTTDQFKNLIEKNCHYCGEKPQKSTNKILMTRGNINEPPFYYNGIDRINSNIGYEIDNCVPCCGVCNYMKNTMTTDMFFKQITKIYLKSLKD